MSKTFLKISLGILAAAGMWQAADAAVTAPVKPLAGHVPAVVSKLTAIGRPSATNTIHLAIGLSLRNQEGLDALLQQVNDPASPNYHRYFSAAQFTDQFGPTPADYQAVAAFAQASGLKVTAQHGNRMLLEVDGKVSDVEHAFNVTLQNYNHPTEKRVFFAPATEPVVPAALPIVEIGGLNNYSRPHTHNVSISLTNSTVTPARGSAPGGFYIGDDFRTAYVPGTPLTGAGQKVALVQFDGYTSNDITAYESLANRSAVSLTNILLSGFNGQPTGNGNEVEVSLDIEMIIAMAPGISQILVYEGNIFNFQPNVLLNQIAVDNAARQISSSWTWSGGPSQISDQIFKEMAIQGQTYFNASGDQDAYLPGQVDSPSQVYCPASSPYITAVGGATLQTAGPDGPYLGERVWNYTQLGRDGAGSCGGISSYYAIPTWQQGISMTNNHGSTVNRNIPDVCLTADNVFVYADGGPTPQAGTSCAAPLWAGFTALMNQQAVSNNLPAIGFLNPKIYALAKTTNYANCFLDITQGNNEWSASPTNFPATTGYDLCTGLGSPNGTNLINALANPASTNSTGTTNYPVIISAPPSPWGTNLAAMNGGNPNGAWFLFVRDDAPLNVGMINGGWAVSVTTGTPVGVPADKQIYAPTNLFLALNATTNITLAVTNYGPATATNVVITDTLPGAGMTLKSVTPSANVTTNSTTLTWSLGNLATNAGGAITLTFTGTASGNYTNSPAIYSATSDPNPDDKFADTVFTVAQPQPPQLSAFTAANGHFVLTITNDAAITTIIQATTNLLSPNWVNVFTGTPPFTTNIDVLTNYPSRFYRAVIGGQ